MKRGEIWTVAGSGNYAGKPRPAVILQEDQFETMDSVTVCFFTSNELEAPFFRIKIDPRTHNNLRTPCSLMADKITTVPKTKLGYRIGHLAAADILRLNQAILVFLGLAASPRVAIRASTARDGS